MLTPKGFTPTTIEIKVLFDVFATSISWLQLGVVKEHNNGGHIVLGLSLQRLVDQLIGDAVSILNKTIVFAR